jgi:N-acetylglutamate synthase-like GNAT family acetyltransferase
MNASSHRVRRATLEDLPVLRVLWNSMHFPLDQLERRLTEFQVVESTDGHIVGAIGIEILRQHGWLHNEAYEDYALADEVRPLLVDRLQSLASNHGVFRLWTREKSPFWTRHGFQPAAPETLKKLPETWRDSGSEWLTLQLKDEDAIVSLEKELLLFKETEKQGTQLALRRARAVKIIATLLACVFAVFVLGTMIYLFRKNPAAFTPQK